MLLIYRVTRIEQDYHTEWPIMFSSSMLFLMNAINLIWFFQHLQQLIKLMYINLWTLLTTLIVEGSTVRKKSLNNFLENVSSEKSKFLDEKLESGKRKVQLPWRALLVFKQHNLSLLSTSRSSWSFLHWAVKWTFHFSWVVHFAAFLDFFSGSCGQWFILLDFVPLCS